VTQGWASMSGARGIMYRHRWPKPPRLHAEDRDVFGNLLTSVDEISGKRNVQSTAALRSSIR
jgi:hypothetical protein